jgi:hypothetical protein
MKTRSIEVYNHFGIGDLFESREFVREWMRVTGMTQATYACRFPAVFEDMPEISCVPLSSNHNMRTPVRRVNGNLSVNTWIGALNGNTKPKGDYVIWPGAGCTVEGLFRMHGYYMKMIGYPRLTGDPARFLSNIDYSRVPLGGTQEFIESHQGKRMILVCNGPTSSQHAENFDMAKMVDAMPESDDIYILTERARVERTNVFFTDDITQRNGRCDVNAISYLSTACDVIVGRCSGAQMVCETRDNWMNPNKTLVSFTHHRNGACFPFNREALGLKMRLVHSTASAPEGAAMVLREVLN